MAFLILGLFVAVVVALAYVSHRTGTSSDGCCAPADPRRDLRMRS